MIAMATAGKIEDLTLSINEEIHVKAPLAVTFDSLLEQLGSSMEMLNGEAIPMKLEAVAGRALVSRPGRRQRAPLGARAGDQAADAA